MFKTTLTLALLQSVLLAHAAQTVTIDIGGGSSGTTVSSSSIDIEVGDTVVWNNVGVSIKTVGQQAESHQCTPIKGSIFSSGQLFPQSSYQFTFNRPSVYYFYVDSTLKDCTSGGAEGVINVKALPSPEPKATGTAVATSGGADRSGTAAGRPTATTGGSNSNGSRTSSGVVAEGSNGNQPTGVMTGNGVGNGLQSGSPVPKAPLSGGGSLVMRDIGARAWEVALVAAMAYLLL
ncbi:hypothetical protein BJ741DRAFT_605073 [Chytriomyces cf. hyalinus JEL632]|nr:hypothetical protein BJ741DRAFT_605073 [Chytriomyces cf. hyalinus JEL632]